MQLVERRIIKPSHEAWSRIDEMSFAAKNLYNVANYNCRQAYFNGGEKLVPSYNTLYHLIKDSEQYQALPAKVAQQTLMLVSQNWLAYFAGLEKYQIAPHEFTGKPKPPKYLDKDGRHVLTFTEQATSKTSLAIGLIKLSTIDYVFDSQIVLGRVNIYCQSRIVPKLNHYVLEIVYEVADPAIKQSDQVASIDLGIDNLMAVTSNVPGFQPVLINGRPLKSLNQFYNMKRAQLQSDSGLRTSKRLKHLTTSRNHKVKDYLHRASRVVIDLLVDADITTLVIGKNPDWKRNTQLGRANNQNFVQIPHSQLIAMLSYKGALAGIKVITQEESYTSKSSFLDLDLIPTYGAKPSYWKPSGTRIKRGLYKSKRHLINADVNGSYNILVKAFPDAFGIGDREVLVHPRKINLPGYAPM
ncbi:RNA-guided endonuclease InsQ/TnpB family protein [Iningainema tapete]|uniref:IS200/IS605 family element transposase accessory protein TnpB n=1 Tax=Iningainema tapete BLCC-T55 TaxID=2748662 RepID=A0A8J6XNM9_9CYAN|nr:RNA-guided endonuclease TnpB family protein [Iningainema tapete]MBD2776351.1 IS200/IS605 family element transposase accessory protein TnpB [Iningainema tapete BLCC-T55]